MIFILITGCKTTDKLDIDNNLSKAAKASLLDLQSYIEPKWDNTYNFRHERIKLPTNYKELVWKTEFGDVLKES